MPSGHSKGLTSSSVFRCFVGFHLSPSFAVHCNQPPNGSSPKKSGLERQNCVRLVVFKTDRGERKPQQQHGECQREGESSTPFSFCHYGNVFKFLGNQSMTLLSYHFKIEHSSPSPLKLVTHKQKDKRTWRTAFSFQLPVPGLDEKPALS